jgi:hypothetical protein
LRDSVQLIRGLVRFYHANITFNFWNPNLTPWNLDCQNSTSGGQKDLYTVALHEITHALGFSSLITANGNSFFAPNLNYYQRYDLNLRTSITSVPSNTNLISQNSTCGMYNVNYNSAVPTTLIDPGLCPTNTVNCNNAIVYNSTNVGTVPTYVPACYAGASTLSHFDDECTAAIPIGTACLPNCNDLYYTMSNAILPNSDKRAFSPAERGVLCDLGYNVGTTFGNPTNLNLTTYTGGSCNGNQPVGYNDGVTSGAYSLICPLGGSLNFTDADLLLNDVNATSIECVQILGSPLSTLVNATNSYTFNANGTPPGFVLVRYIPVNANGQRGNITYVLIYIPNGNCTYTACDLVGNGDFESSNGICGQFPPGGIPCWTSAHGTPDYFNMGCISPSLGVIPTSNSPFWQTGVNTSATNNDGMIGIGALLFAGANSGIEEASQTNLSSPLIVGNAYSLSFQARSSTSPNPALNTQVANVSFVTIRGSQNLLAPGVGNFNFANPNLSLIDLSINGFVIPNDNLWHTITTNFTYAGPPNTDVLVFVNNITNNPSIDQTNNWKSYIHLDNVVLQQLQTQTIPPIQICFGLNINDMSSLLNQPNSAATFTGTGVTGSGPYMFNSAIAGMGIHVITYNFVSATGCIISGTFNIEVVSNVNPFSASITGPNCLTNGNIELTASPAPPNFTYLWAGPNGNVLGTNGIPLGLTGSVLGSIIPNSQNSGVYTVTVTNASGCTSTSTYNVSLGPITLTTTANQANIGCGGSSALNGTATACCSNQYPISNIDWTGPNGTTFSNPSCNNATFVNPFNCSTTANNITSTSVFTMTATDKLGCTNITTQVVNVLPNPLIVTSLLTNTTCTGSTFVLYMNGATSYTINPGNFVTTNTNYNSTYTINNVSSNTIYTITGTDGICTSTATILLNGSVANSSFCNCAATLPANSYLTIEKAFAFTNDIVTAIINYNQGATNPIPLITGTNSYTIGSASAVSTILFSGDLNLTSDMTFVNCNIKMVPYYLNGANITSISGHTFNGHNLTIDNCIIEGCGEMWEGIYMPNIVNTIHIKGNSILRDMIEGVRVVGEYVTIKVENSTFENNLIGINVKGQNENTNGYITNNTFTSSALKAPYLGAKGNHGIKLINTISSFAIGGAINSGDGNTFNNLNNGIYFGIDPTGLDLDIPASYNFGMTAYNNSFTNILGGVSLENYQLKGGIYSSNPGCGIYIGNPTADTKETPFYQTSNHFISKNNFENCTKAIVANASNMIAEENIIENTQCGILNNLTEWCHYQLNQNQINNTHLGIQMVGNSGNSSTILGNRINLSSNYLTGLRYTYNPGTGQGFYTPYALWPTGIDIKHGNKDTDSPFEIGSIGYQPLEDENSETYSNIISVPGAGGYGIIMNNTGTGYSVARNLVRYYSQITEPCGPMPPLQGICGNFIGIQISNALNSKFYENKIVSQNSWNSAAFNARSSTGIYIDQSKDLVLHCNTTARLRYGFDVRGNCEPAPTNPRAICKNNVEDHRIGWLFRSYTSNPGGFGQEIGVGEDNDNRFTGNYFSSNPSASCTQFGVGLSPTKIMRMTNNGDLGFYKISINPATNNTINFGTNSWPDSKSNICGKEYQPQDVNETAPIDCSQPSTFRMNAADNPSGIDAVEAITNHTGIFYPLFDEVADFMDKASLYSLLDREPDIKQNSTVLDAYYTLQQNTNIAALREADKALALLLDSISAMDETVYNARLTALDNANAAIINNGHNYENCEKWINTIYSTILQEGLGAIDSPDLNQIAILAQQCPAATGTCVYKARSVMAMLMPGMQYNDNVACAALLPQNKGGKDPYATEEDLLNSLVPDPSNISIDANQVLIYPNPAKANASITIRYNFADADKVVGVVKDITGKTVQAMQLQGGNRRIETTLSDLSPGIYTIEILVNDKKAHSQLLHIQR